MKYSEFHKEIRKAGWIVDRQSGSHIIYIKEIDGKEVSISIPNHGTKEIPNGLEKTIRKKVGI